jgi:hypothetical protein
MDPHPPELNLSLSAARGRDIVLRCPRRPAQRYVSETAQRAVPSRCAPGPSHKSPQETPTVQSERGLSQTAARLLAGVLNLPRREPAKGVASLLPRCCPFCWVLRSFRWNSRVVFRYVWLGFPIPTGLQLSAPGCEGRATRGKRHRIHNPERVGSAS